MFERIANSWSLIRQSARVVRLDKELLLFPLLSGISCVLVMASFAVPAMMNPQFIEAAQETGPEQTIAAVAVFLFYVANYFVIIFFNSALIACAVIRFEGRNPTLMDGLRAAGSRVPQIFGWALVSATIGVILKIIESRSERVGEIVASVMGMAWSATTFFVVPVLVVERVGPIEAVKRSLAMLRKSWGEALGVNFGVGLISFLAMFVAAIPLFLGFYAISAGHNALGAVGLVCGVLLIILTALVTSTLQSISLAAIYMYASQQVVPEQFEESNLSSVFVPH